MAKSPSERRMHARSVGARRAEQQAEQLLHRLGVEKAPVPVEHLALRLGLQVERTELGDDVSGVLVVEDRRGVIGISVTEAPVRQRFSVAHEIGHFILHRAQLSVFIDKQFFKPYYAAFRDARSSAGTEKREREANAFAAALLMPAHLVRDAIADLRMDVADEDALDALASRFEVSRQAMSFRVAKLAIFEGQPSR
ncbi:MAG: ImmA/IrrE family metallo-endopeptidase [Gemmatimonadales bacterium]